MADLLGVSVDELVSILKRKKARVPFEIGAFVALEACEAVARGPARITTRDVRIGDDGAVSVFAPPNSASMEEAARSVVQVLAHLLVAAGPGVPPTLIELVDNGPSDGRWDLARLRDELEASLVPLNRQAARRVLARMLREAARDGDVKKSSLPPPPAPDDVDAALDDLVGAVPKAPRAPKDDRITPLADVEAAPPPRVPKKTPQVLYAPEPIAAPRARGDQVWVGDAKARPRMRDDDSIPQTLDRGLRAGQGGALPPRAEDDYEFEQQATFVKDRVSPSEPPPFAVVDASRGADNGAGRVGRSDPLRPRSAPPAARIEVRSEYEEPPYEQAMTDPYDPDPRELPRGPLPSGSDGGFDPVVRRDGEVDLSSLDVPKRSRGLLYAVIFVVLSAGLLVTVAALRPDAVARFLGNETPEEREARRLADERAAEQAQLLSDHAAGYGDLTVEADVAGAQVLMFLGRGPATVEQMPLGVAHEIIVIADGKAPSRVVVPPTEEWETTDDGRMLEIAAQAGSADMSPDELVLGPTLLTQDMGAPTGELGRIRVVTTPRGAKVYLLIGFTPGVHMDNARTDRPIELLVWAEEHAIARAVVGPSDWTDGEGGHKSARVDVTLVPLDPEAAEREGREKRR